MNRKLMAIIAGTALCQTAPDETTTGSGAGSSPTPPAVIQNPVHLAIKANFDNKIDVKDFKFHFKKVKELDSEGKETGVETKRPTVELALPVPSVEGVIAILEAGGKQLDLLMETVQEVISNRARDLVNEQEDISQANIDLSKLTWEAIANLPRAERRGGGIAKETWEEFGEDYIAVMPAVTGKSADQVGNAAKILLTKFATVKTNKPVLKLLKDQIGLYVTSSPNAEKFAECVAFLTEKADTLINVNEADLLKNL
jgi:hypothetical protein